MDIDFGAHLIAADGRPGLDAVISNPAVHMKPDGKTPWRVKFPSKAPQHILTFGPTRSGKGQRLIAPELLHDLDRSMVVVDPKGELASWTAEHRARNGSEVYAIDPWGVLERTPGLHLKSVGYNPMRWLDPKNPNFIDEAVGIADALCPIENERDPHWELRARDMIAGLIMYHRLVDGEAASLSSLRLDLGNTPREWRELMEGRDTENPDDYDGLTRDGKMCAKMAAKYHKIPAMRTKLSDLADVDGENRELSSVFSTFKAKTSFLDSPLLQADLERPGVDFAPLKQKPVTVYIVIPADYLETHSVWLRLVVSGAIRVLRRTLKNSRPDVLFILDEFAQLGKMEMVEKGVALNAGYGIKFWVFVQNLTQLKMIYGDNYEAFTSAGVLTSFASRDPTTSEFLSKISGERGVDVQSISRDQQGGKSISNSVQRRENIMPHQFEQMPAGMMFVRMPSQQHGLEKYITHVQEFHQRSDTPQAVKNRFAG